jgi:putative Mg2+ transporter-C (MgtC) family protein
MSDEWDKVLEALQDEFSDLSDLGDATRVAVRLLVAALLGAILGYNRERHGKSAGLRTHMLVSMGSALFVMVPLFAGMEISDLSRVLQGVTAGIGFLCAGSIIKQKNEGEVFGLTTAAGIWTTAAIGVACGMGREVTAMIGTVLAWIVLEIVQRLYGSRREEHH